MGVLNVTPDSFSDGGQFLDVDKALAHAELMIREGADLIDVGGESTRPGAALVSENEELDRVIPIIEALRKTSDIAISLDSSTPAVMREAVSHKIDLINDVRALRRDDAMSVVAGCDVPVCLMHMKGDPATMQMDPQYSNVVQEINDFFAERIATCELAGIERKRIVLDPGFGFGKKPSHNFVLLNRLQEFGQHGLPLLVGVSRKSTIGRITEDRLSGSLAGAVIAGQNGARIVRVHEVAETVSALSVMNAIKSETREFDE